jgi:transcriptional regulator with XRE-family HTH domain
LEIRTTTELRALRQLLGLSLNEVAMLLCEDKAFLEQSERGRNWNIPAQYRDALLRWDEHVQAFIDDMEEIGDRYVLVYSRDEIYREFEPDWSQRLPTAIMHFAAAGRAKAELPDRDLILVLMVPTSYHQYLNRDPSGKAFPDDRLSRQLWAAAFCKNYRIMEARDESTIR